MTAPLWLCRPVAKGVVAVKRATRPIRRIRRAAGAATVRTAARKAVWVCIVTGPLLVPSGSVPSLFDAPIRITPEMGVTNSAAISGSIGQLLGITEQLAFLPPGLGSDVPAPFFMPPPAQEAEFAIPLGTIEWVPVPDCCSPLPQPVPEPEQPKPVPEPASLALLATAVVLLRSLI
jgi:hypothetical protein